MTTSTLTLAQAQGSSEDLAPLWTLREVASYLRVSPTTVRRWTNAGMLPCYRLGGNKERRFSKDAVLAFIAQNEQPLRG